MLKSNRRQESGTPDRPRLFRRISWWQVILWGLAAVAGAYAWAIQVDIADVAPNSTGWWIFSGSTRKIMRRVGIGCTVIMILIPAILTVAATIRARRAKRRETEQVAQRVLTITGVIAPLAAYLQRLAHLDPGATLPRERLAGEAVSATLAGLFDLHGGSRSKVRVCFFVVEGEAPNRRLVPKCHYGRGRKSTCTVYEGDGGRGTEAFQALDARRARSWREGNGEEVPAGWTQDKEYRSFLAVHVATESALYGMITMDAIDPEAFPKVDLPTVQTVADLYAAILAGLSAPKDHPDLSGATFER